MASLNRRLRFEAAVSLLLVLSMAGWVQAATITVNTLDGGSDTAPLCTLVDAVTAANTHAVVNGCAAGSGNDTIVFTVTGTITLVSTLPTIIDDGLIITGPSTGIEISGNDSVPVMSHFSPPMTNTTLTLNHLTIAHGKGGSGAAIQNMGGTLLINDCTFSKNTGATIDDTSLPSNAFMTVADSTFVDNSGGDAISDSSDLLIVTNSTFSGNTSPDNGGTAISAGGLSTLITNCTFSGNTSTEPASAALRNFSGRTVSVHGSIFSHNSLSNCRAPITDAGYNISDDDSCGFGATSVNSSTTLFLDPAGLANNGGKTETIALEPNSQAVDFIPVADCTDQSSPTPQPLKTDQRGEPRPDPGNPNFCDAGAYELQTSQNFILNAEKIQVAFGSAANSDEVNMALTLTDTPSPTCDTADDVLRNGLMVQLFHGSCGDLMGSGLMLDLNPFVVHTVGGESYGTLFQSMSPETVSARMVALPTPGDTCGKWTLNLEVAGLDTAALGLTGNPFALILEDSDLHGFGCFDINNAIVGNQITPPTRTVRRGVRR